MSHKSTNKIAIENSKRGTSDWKLDKPALNREIEGYASQTSINAGESINLFVSSISPRYSLTVYRMGWYKGLGARQITDPITLTGIVQETPVPDAETGMVECNWTNSYTLITSASWTSGVYLAKLEEQKSNTQSYIIFVIRDDENSPSLLFQLPITTYQAYNYWGGKSLYDTGSGSLEKWGTNTGEHATKVSFNRPFARSNNTKAAFGVGAGEFLTNVQPVTTHNYPISSAAWDYNMVRWLEKNNYDLGYITNIDTHNKPNLLTKTKVFLSQGHDEYWSAEMRNNVTLARDSGVNLTFFSSNTMYWQVRLEKSTLTQEPNRTMVCYKNADEDPIKGIKSTINYRDIKEQKSEATVMGVQYILDPVQGHIKISNPDHWVFANTNLKQGQLLKGLLGYEVDAVVKDSPNNVIILASSPCQNVGKSDYLAILKYMIKKMVSLPSSILINTLKISETMSANIVWLAIAAVLIAGCAATFNFGFAFVMPFALLFLLAFAVWFVKITRSGKVVSHMTLYKADSGAQVFATGSMQWSWGLDDFNVPMLRKSRQSKQVEIITENVLRAFGAKKTAPN
ncbi:N,N-dimethylformamidase beta subunit family domain-containing protein [Spongiimicrobium sp. 3-5]|uniref:N,N-dimethylformamidase beta subunit family domain-containing protein n=1 Tax=Spongiimicrobium sp. 3-5 TaxID=3332596 RepID=UPI00397F9640